MTGQKIKEILTREGLTLAEVARLLGYKGDQRLHNALRSDDVKSGLIEAIAKVTNKSVCLFYGIQPAVNDHGILDSDGATYNATEITTQFIGLITRKDEQHLSEIAEQRKLTETAQSNLATAQSQISELISHNNELVAQLVALVSTVTPK